MEFHRDREGVNRPRRQIASGAFLSEKLYDKWVATTSYTFAIAMVILLVVQTRTSFSIDQEQLSALAATSGVFAGLALAVTPLITHGVPQEFSRRGFLLLALTFTLAAVLTLGAKLENGVSSTLTLYLFAMVALVITSGGTRSAKRRFDKYEFYIEFVFVLLAIIPTINLLGAGVVLFLLGSIQLIGLLAFAFLATFVRSSIQMKLEHEQKIKTFVGSLLQEKKAMALSFDDVFRDVTAGPNNVSPHELQILLDEMDHEILLGNPSLTVITGKYVPRWKESYRAIVLGSLPQILRTYRSGEAANEGFLRKIAEVSALSPELIDQHLGIARIINEYYRDIDQGRKLVLKASFLDLRQKFMKISRSPIEKETDLANLVDPFERATQGLRELKDDDKVVEAVLEHESKTLSELEDLSRAYIVKTIAEHDKSGQLPKEDMRLGTNRFDAILETDGPTRRIRRILEDTIMLSAFGASHFVTQLLRRLGESAGVEYEKKLAESSAQESKEP